LLDQCKAVLDEYREHLPLTIRQVFYRLVGSAGYDKAERAYARLCEALNRARRAGRVSFDAVRDDGATLREPSEWESPVEVVEVFVHEARNFRLPRQTGQPRRLLIAVEAAGMVPQVERVAAPFGVPISSGGGFDSLAAKRDLARLLAKWGRAEVLHIGDHDPCAQRPEVFRP
jgi:glycine/D-amino acid oxidase-like deaminating enzyme